VGTNHISGTAVVLGAISSPASVVGQLLITPTVEIRIKQLGQVEEMVWLPLYHMMRYRICSMCWASASRGSVSGSGDSYFYILCQLILPPWCRARNVNILRHLRSDSGDGATALALSLLHLSIQFYLNNVTNLHPLTSQSTTCLAVQHRDRRLL